jgi:uncharacterized hydrophobic protein (TIGR00271 family)
MGQGEEPRPGPARPDADEPDTAPDRTEADGTDPAATTRRFRRPQLSAEERRAAMDALMVSPTPRSLRRFAVLMTLSVVVAALGLLQDSTAVVVGAMVIAPLMAPIMGLAASLVMGWGGRLLTGVTVVGLSVAGAIAISWAMAAFLPEAGTGLPDEVVSRASPDVRDLLIALAAGTAGAYATVRKDMSGALPGVAVAVALVPPLASIGLLLGRGQPDLAGGAGLLFATNLFGIVFAAAIVFVATGFVPPHRFRHSGRAVYIAFAAMAIPILLVGTVLTNRFLVTVERAHDLRVATQVVLDWVGPTADLNRVTLSDTTMQVNVASETSPPPVRTLTEALSEALGRPVTVDLRWTPLSPAAEPTTPTLALDQVRPVVQEWLSGQSLTLDGLSYDSGTLVVQTSGEQPPESSDELAGLIGERFGVTPSVGLTWTRTSADETAAEDARESTARTVVDAWIRRHPGTVALGVDRSDSGVTVTIAAADRPEADDLRTELETALPGVGISVQWVPSSELAPSASPTG